MTAQGKSLEVLVGATPSETRDGFIKRGRAMTKTHYHAYGHRNDMGYAVIRKNTGADLVNYGRGFLVKLYTDVGTFVRFAGTWKLLRDAKQEAAALGFTTIRKQ